MSFGHQGNASVKVEQVVNAILYRLKTGCQWRLLPMGMFFDTPYSWKSVYYHFQKWSKGGYWEKVLKRILSEHKELIDTSSIQLDGSHTIAKRGGEAVAYQGRKKHKTTNLLLLTDANGIPIACSMPIAGNHNDVFQITHHFTSMLNSLQQSGLRTDGLFMNADAGFDTDELRALCHQNDIVGNIDLNSRNGRKSDDYFDELLYRKRYVIERTNAWMDAFKALLIRYETNSKHWWGLNLLACIVIITRKL